MAIINKAAFAKALWPGINAWWGKAYDEYPVLYTKLFDTYTSTRNAEEDVGIVSFGLAAQKPEGNGVLYDTESQGFVTRYTHVTYGLGFVITDEAVEDDQYMVIGERKAKGLAFSMRQTKEIVGHNTYNNAFSTATTGDSLSILNSAHVNISGGTWSNVPSTYTDLSESALEQAVIDISGYTNDRGLRIHVLPKTLIIPTASMFEVKRILGSPLQVDSANNTLNALKAMGYFTDVVVTPYITDTDSWFIRTNVPEGMKYFERRGDTFSEDNDFDTDNLKYKATARYSFGCTDPRALYGSTGA
jgi:hypothetical protein